MIILNDVELTPVLCIPPAHTSHLGYGQGTRELMQENPLINLIVVAISPARMIPFNVCIDLFTITVAVDTVVLLISSLTVTCIIK